LHIIYFEILLQGAVKQVFSGMLAIASKLAIDANPNRPLNC
jgi:hypothetical protein